MDRQMILAMVLSMGVIIGYYTLFPPPEPQKPAPKEQAAAEQTTGGTGAPAQSVQQSAEQAPVARETAPLVAPAQSTEQLESPHQVVVETGRYTARFDARGGRLASLELNRYRKSKASIDWADAIPFLREYLGKKETLEAGNVEMIKSEAGILPFDVMLTGEEANSRKLLETVYSASRDGLHFTNEQAPAEEIVFSAHLDDGLVVRKVFTFRPDAYLFEYELQLINRSTKPRRVGAMNLLGEGPDRGSDLGNVQSHFGPIFSEEGSVSTETADDIEGRLIVRNPDWAGITANYFLTAAVMTKGNKSMEFRAVELPQGQEDSKWVAYLGSELPQVELAPGEMSTSKAQVYMGPKKTAEMMKFGGKLESALDLTLDVLASPLLAMLHWFFGLSGNYGVAIILLTILVRVVLFPLTYKGMVSMKRMQKLQPKMVDLREKYKNNKEKLNKEMIGMYSRYGVNPLGGCLPIALQIPIFFALYSALMGSIELRHEPFMLWIVDLSAKDPLYVTPILMGLTMFIQQKLTPSAMDPTQQKIMMWMPVIFLVFMMNFPSGLVLYWLTSNLLSILQQVIINRVNVPDLVEKQKKKK